MSNLPPTSTPPPPSDERTLSGGIRQGILLAVIMLTSLGGYLTVLKWRGHDYLCKTWTPLDDTVPFQPAWVWVYLIPYLIAPVAIGAMLPSNFTWYVQRGLVVVAISLIIFAAAPTQVAPRPPSNFGDGVTGMMYKHMVEVDEPPANAAPSLHVSLTFLLALALCRDAPRWAWLTITCVVLVWLATLFTRQHHIIDVVTGILLASLVVAFWPKKATAVINGSGG
jgi:membrane-associated phospholipid phosphatase